MKGKGLSRIAPCVAVLSSVAPAGTISPGDVLVTDSNQGGYVYRVDPTTGGISVLAHPVPVGTENIDVAGDGQIYLCRGDSVSRLDAASGSTTLIDDRFKDLKDIAVSQDGYLFAADEWDPEYGANRIRVSRLDLATGGLKRFPTIEGHVAGMGLAPNGDIIVASRDDPTQIHRFDPVGGSGRLVVSLAEANMSALDVGPSGEIYCGRHGEAWRIDPADGSSTMICNTIGFALNDIAVGDDGSVFAAVGDGRLARFDPATGNWPVVASGLGYNNKIAVFPGLGTSWRHDPATLGGWSDPVNWTAGVPTASVDAVIDNEGTAEISSEVSNAEAKSLHAGRSNTGAVIQNGGTITIARDLYLGYRSGSRGTYNLAGGSLHAGNMCIGGSESRRGGSGTLDVNAGGTVDVPSTLRIWADGTVNLSGGRLAANTIENGGAFHFAAGTLHVCAFAGDLTNAGGTLARRSSSGVTTIEGDYEQTATGALLIRVSGNDDGNPGRPQCDVFAVTGNLRLAGKLGLNWMGIEDDRESMFGGWYTVATYQGTLTGQFVSYADGNIGSDYVLGVDYGLGVTDGIKVLLFDQLPGDADLDAIVNLGDIVAAIGNWQATGERATWSNGDVNLDGIVNLSDIVVMIGNWQSAPPVGGVMAYSREPAPLPEVGTLSLLAMGACLHLRRRRTCLSMRERSLPRE